MSDYVCKVISLFCNFYNNLTNQFHVFRLIISIVACLLAKESSSFAWEERFLFGLLLEELGILIIV